MAIYNIIVPDPSVIGNMLGVDPPLLHYPYINNGTGWLFKASGACAPKGMMISVTDDLPTGDGGSGGSYVWGG